MKLKARENITPTLGTFQVQNEPFINARDMENVGTRKGTDLKRR